MSGEHGGFPRDPLRRTGRTSRMLKEARNAATVGNRVVVIAATEAHALQMEESFRGFAHEHLHEVEFLSLWRLRSHDFDWRTREFRGDRETLVFIDHYALDKMTGRRRG